MQTENNTNNEKLLDRIAKLLDLSKSPNQYEAESAAAMAADLMSKHELDEADIRLHANGDAAPAEPVIHEDIAENKNAENWKGILSTGCAQGFGCKMWWDYDYRKDHPGDKVKRIVLTRILGRKTAIQAVRYTYAYLVREIERMAQEEWLKEDPKPLAAAAVAWRNSFKLGCATEVRNRLFNQRKEFMDPRSHMTSDNADASKALVLVKKGQAEIEFAYKKLKLGKGSGYRISSRDAYGAGKTAGANVNLSGGRAIGASPRKISGQS